MKIKSISNKILSILLSAALVCTGANNTAIASEQTQVVYEMEAETTQQESTEDVVEIEAESAEVKTQTEGETVVESTELETVVSETVTETHTERETVSDEAVTEEQTTEIPEIAAVITEESADALRTTDDEDWIVTQGLNEDGSVTINETNFPDDIFRGYVTNCCDDDSNGVLSKDEIDTFTNFNMRITNVKSLQGIEYLTELTTLICKSEYLTELDVSKNTSLEKLICEFCELSWLNVSGCEGLTYLDCSYNNLGELDVIPFFSSISTVRTLCLLCSKP